METISLSEIMAHSTGRLCPLINMYQQFFTSQIMDINGLLNAPIPEVNHTVEEGVCSILLGLSKI